MPQKRRNPTGVKRQGFDQGQVSQASSEIKSATSPLLHQDLRAAIVLSRRFALPISTALVVAELAGFREVRT